MGIYDFTVKTNRGEEKKMSEYKGKVLVERFEPTTAPSDMATKIEALL